MRRKASLPSADFVEFPYYSLRNISCPEDTENNRKVLSGHAPATSVLTLSTDENVRDYLLDAEGKSRRTPTGVHRAIRDTIVNYPHNFSILNGGVVIVARRYEDVEDRKCLRLYKPSIINGSQTQGVLKDFYKELQEKSGEEPPLIHIKYELIVTDDEPLIAETSIARNYQNDVMSISIAGRLGQLDEIEAKLQEKLPGRKLRKSETELSDDYLDTERLLQVITALIPEELWIKEGEADNPNKVFTYNQKARCLKQFREINAVAKGKKTDTEKKIHTAKYKELYQFYLDIAPQAYELHEKWKKHPGFKGTGLRSIIRDEEGNVLEVPDGIIFPILASFSAFAKKTAQGWKIDQPDIFQDEEIIRAAKSAYQDIAKSKAEAMGKNKACYSYLYQLTYQLASVYKRLTIVQENAGNQQLKLL